MEYNISDRHRKVIRLYREGNIQKEISKELKMCHKTVSKILRDNNVTKYTRDVFCNWCSKKFVTEYRHQNSCSQSCRSKYNKRNRGTKQVCVRCGDVFFGYVLNDHCTVECKHEGQKEVRDKKALAIRLVRAIDPNRFGECLECGRKFYLSSIGKSYCSKSCSRARHKRFNPEQYKAKPKRYNHKCRECGKHYTDNMMNSAGCSSQCKNKYANRINYNTRKRKIIANGKVDWDISVERLSKRDKGICYLCGTKVNFGDYSRDSDGYFIAGDYYPSIDHTKPISKGGTHTWDNTKLAHRICNSMKSNNLTNNEVKQLTLL